ncbi:MAG: mechanosensitive ion channel family protein [Rhizobiales bacterium]|nr:mechanosensitive ion channel family protein [Hyphomicrobiales bacterium]
MLAAILVGSPATIQAAEPSSEQLQALADLLRDPDIQEWLRSEAAANGERASDGGVAAQDSMAMQAMMTDRLDATRDFLAGLAAAMPTLPGELQQAWSRVVTEPEAKGPIGILTLLALFLGLGYGTEWLFWWASHGWRQRVIQARLDTEGERLAVVGQRLLYGLCVIAAFGLGSVGAFLMFDWPPLLRQVVLTYLLVLLVLRLSLALCRFLLAPGAERFRVVPMSTGAAGFWFIWAPVLIGWFVFVNQTLNLLDLLGTSRSAGYLFGLACGVVLVGLTLYVIWRHPERVGETPASERNRPAAWLLSIYVIIVWLLLFTGSVTPFYVGVLLLLLPIVLRGVRLGVNHVLRPAGMAAGDDALPTISAVCLERGLRALVLIGGAYLIAWLLEVDVGAMTSQETLRARFLRGAVNAMVIALLADFVWHLARAWIDCRIATAGSVSDADDDQARRNARLRTLLPILRNVLLIVLATMAALMILSAVGIEIAPLIAGAGVVGVAIGFGAQTLVKDVISGIFFLLDDAFRVGEYIQSGGYRGTVEAFSLRSVKLRHHRGPLTTVPFGELGAIENMSRDWVIDKMTVSVTYDTDLDQAKKVIKQIGRALLEEPGFAPHIIETLKMQGVEQFGDFAIQLRLKMMTKPGEQFVIRRRAFALIKKAFAANGIEFAFPTVSVAGGGEQAAAAKAGLDLVAAPGSAT